MSNNFPSNPPNYTPLFEIGIINDVNPAVKGFAGICSAITPITLAAIMTALFETVMMNVEESKQIQYEQHFNKAFKKLMKERHTLDITKKFFDPMDLNENEDEN